MEYNKRTIKLLKKLNLIDREGEFDEFDKFDDEEQILGEDPDYGFTQTDSTTKFPPKQNSPTHTQNSHFEDRNNNNSIGMIAFTESDPKGHNTILPIKVCLQKPFISLIVMFGQTIKTHTLGIKFGTNEPPYLNLWLIVLAITGAPVLYISSANFKSNKIKTSAVTGVLLALLVIYHLLFVKSALHVLETLPANKGLYDSVWLHIYPIVFNLAVIIVNDVMWVVGLGTGCWMTDILQSLKEKPRAGKVLVDVRYDYYGGEHKIIVGQNKHQNKGTKHMSKLKMRTKFLWKSLNFFVRQFLAFGCCFSYLFVSFYLLKPIELNFLFVLEIINVLLTCLAWLTILWVYMSICQMLSWRFQHLNDWVWEFRKLQNLPDMTQFLVLIYTYQDYSAIVTIVDDFFKYWIAGIFGVLFFQASLYFQYVINAFENWPKTLQLLSMPLITIPFMLALLLLIKRAADVNAQSKALEDIIVKTCLYSIENIDHNLYKKIKFFMLIVNQGSSLTIFGLVDITRKLMGSAIVIIYSYTLILHELTSKLSISEEIVRNNLTLNISL